MRPVCLILSLLALSATASAAHAQAPVLATNGSTLSAPANLALPGGANQCLARPYIGTGPGQIQFINTGQSTCMWWSTQYGPDGQPVGNTYVPRGSGAVTRVRIRSGDAPAPLRFAIVRSRERPLLHHEAGLAAGAAGPEPGQPVRRRPPRGLGRGDCPGLAVQTTSWSSSPSGQARCPSTTAARTGSSSARPPTRRRRASCTRRSRSASPTRTSGSWTATRCCCSTTGAASRGRSRTRRRRRRRTRRPPASARRQRPRQPRPPLRPADLRPCARWPPSPPCAGTSPRCDCAACSRRRAGA